MTAATVPSPPLAPYRAVAVRAFRRYATYRGATFAGAVTNTVFGFVYAYVFLAVHEAVGTVDGFDARQTVTYVFGAQAFLMMTGAFGDREISERVRTGEIAADLYRPVDFQGWWLAHDLGKSAYLAVFRGVPPFLVGWLVLDLAVPATVSTWFAFGLTTVLGVVLAFAVRFLANLSAFWLLDGRGVVALTAMAQTFLAGHVVPLYLLPDGIEPLVRLLPFAGITALPVEVFIGAHGGADLAAVVAHQVVWLVVLLGAGRMLLAAARRKLVVHGG